MAEQLESKTCSKCHTPKSLDEFGNNKNHPDGKQYWCKTCSRAAVKDYLKTEHGKANNRRWQQQYLGKVSARS
jgi:hypothetical protein